MSEEIKSLNRIFSPLKQDQNRLLQYREPSIQSIIQSYTANRMIFVRCKKHYFELIKIKPSIFPVI